MQRNVNTTICLRPVTNVASGAWCRHCPNAYCADHADVVTTSDQLGSVCNEHVDEIEFLEETVTNLAELLANPHPTQQELLDWRAARGSVKLLFHWFLIQLLFRCRHYCNSYCKR